MDNACTYGESEKCYENSLWDRQEQFGPWVTEKHCLREKKMSTFQYQEETSS